MKFIENHKALIIAGGLILAFSCGCAAGTVGVQNLIEYGIVSAADKQNDETAFDDGENSAASEIDEDTLAKLALEEADYYLENIPDVPLLKENADPEIADYAESSLESSVNDVNATNKAGDIIRRICRENGIDAKKAKIKDLTREQIALITMEAFKQSEHGK